MMLWETESKYKHKRVRSEITLGSEIVELVMYTVLHVKVWNLLGRWCNSIEIYIDYIYMISEHFARFVLVVDEFHLSYFIRNRAAVRYGDWVIL